MGQFGSAENNRASSDSLDAEQCTQERRLAGTVGAEHGNDLTLIDMHGHAAYRVHTAVAHVEVTRIEQHGCTPSMSRPRRDRYAALTDHRESGPACLRRSYDQNRAPRRA